MKFRVFPFGAFAIVLLDIVSLACLCLVIFSPSPTKPWMWIVFSIMFIALPIILSVHMFSFSLDIITVDASGVKKEHFGKLKKTLTWEKVVTATVYPKNESQGWIILSDFAVSYNFFTLDFMFFDKKSICIKYSKEVALEIEKYLGKKLM